MKKIVYLVAAFGLLYIGLLAGCQKPADTTTAAPEMPSTNAPATNTPAQ